LYPQKTLLEPKLQATTLLDFEKLFNRINTTLPQVEDAKQRPGTGDRKSKQRGAAV
jgi:hypothetical protein